MNELACVPSVSVRFKKRGTRVKDRATNGARKRAKFRQGENCHWRYFHKAKFRWKWKRVVVKTLCSDLCVCCTCTCNCLKRSLQIEWSSMLVIVKPTLVKELTKKKENECQNLIFSILCDISERDKRYTTKHANQAHKSDFFQSSHRKTN